MTIRGRCGTCGREVPVEQLTRPTAGFRCPFCGAAFAPSYASLAPAVLARVLTAQAELVKGLGELRSMVGDRLVMDRESVLDPVAETLPGTREPV